MVERLWDTEEAKVSAGAKWDLIEFGAVRCIVLGVLLASVLLGNSSVPSGPAYSCCGNCTEGVCAAASSGLGIGVFLVYAVASLVCAFVAYRQLYRGRKQAFWTWKTDRPEKKHKWKVLYNEHFFESDTAQVRFQAYLRYFRLVSQLNDRLIDCLVDVSACGLN